MKALIAVGDPYFSFSRNNSAVANYLNSVSELLRELDVELFFYPDDKGHPSGNMKSFNGESWGIKKIIKKFIPGVYNPCSEIYRFMNISRLHREILKLPATDITFDFPGFGAYPGYVLKKRKKTPYVLFYDSPFTEQYSEMYDVPAIFRKLIQRREKTSIQNADIIICYSSAVASHLEKNYNVHNEKCIVLPTMSFRHLTPKKSGKTKTTITIGFIGSFLSYHKTDLLVDVFNKLCKEYSNLELYLIGSGECWQQVYNQVNQSPFREKIIMPGFVTDNDLEKYKQQFDIGVIPFYNWYGSPMKLFEYAALGIPVVAPDTLTISDIFKNGKEVLLFSQKEPVSSMLHCLKKILESQSLRQYLADNIIHALQQRYSKDIYKSTFVKVIESVLSPR